MNFAKMHQLTLIALLSCVAGAVALPLDGSVSKEDFKKKDLTNQSSPDQFAEETSADSSEYAPRELFPSSLDDTSSETVSDVKDTSSLSSEDIADHSIELQGGSQTFFPAFADLFNQRRQTLGHPRQLGFRNQEGAFSQRPNSYRSLLNSFHQPFTGFRSAEFTKPEQNLLENPSGILGSGNFGVIRGGTFFSEDESEYGDSFNPYYNNGHGRPSYIYGGSNPRPNYNQEQFANFRDFADINTPSNSAFSQFVVVYANKNATIADIKKANSQQQDPKNIIETLALLDKEHSDTPVEKISNDKKISKSKSKLSRLQNEKKPWSKKSKTTKGGSEVKDLDDPLLALS